MMPRILGLMSPNRASLISACRITRWRRSSWNAPRAEDLCHGAAGPAVVLEQLFQAVLGLGIARGERRILDRRREDVGNAKLVAVNRGRLIGREDQGRGEGDDAKQNECRDAWEHHGA